MKGAIDEHDAEAETGPPSAIPLWIFHTRTG